MAYTFEGVFIERPAKTAKELEQLFDGYAREIEVPFKGVVLSFRDESSGEMGEDERFVERDNKAFVLEQSRHLPASRIGYIKYDTFGGQFDYIEGFVCQNGQLEMESERSSEMQETSTQAELEELGNSIFLFLLESVGAKHPSLHFAPFERGFFPNT